MRRSTGVLSDQDNAEYMMMLNWLIRISSKDDFLIKSKANPLFMFPPLSLLDDKARVCMLVSSSKRSAYFNTRIHSIDNNLIINDERKARKCLEALRTYSATKRQYGRSIASLTDLNSQTEVNDAQVNSLSCNIISEQYYDVNNAEQYLSHNNLSFTYDEAVIEDVNIAYRNTKSMHDLRSIYYSYRYENKSFLGNTRKACNVVFSILPDTYRNCTLKGFGKVLLIDLVTLPFVIARALIYDVFTKNADIAYGNLDDVYCSKRIASYINGVISSNMLEDADDFLNEDIRYCGHYNYICWHAEKWYSR